MRATQPETLRKRQRCHDMRDEGMSQRQIQQVLNASRATVRDWLARERPTVSNMLQKVLDGVVADSGLDVT